MRVAEGAAEGASARRAWGEGCAVGSALGARRRAGCGEAKAGTDAVALKRAFGLFCNAAFSTTVGGVGRACGTSLGTREVRMLRAVVVRGSRACTDGRKACGKHSGARPLLGAFVLHGNAVCAAGAGGWGRACGTRLGTREAHAMCAVGARGTRSCFGWCGMEGRSAWLRFCMCLGLAAARCLRPETAEPRGVISNVYRGHCPASVARQIIPSVTLLVTASCGRSASPVPHGCL